MNIRISAEKLESFVGDVRPVWLISDENLKHEAIKWSLVGDAVKMKTYRGCDHGNFSYGVMLTFIKEGSATVVAEHADKKYECRVTARKMRDFSGKKLNFYRGDLHEHTTPEHTHDKFLVRTDYSYPDYLNYIKNANQRDFAAISDHASTIDLENFYRGASSYEEMRDEMEPVIFPGCEGEIMYTEEDRFGIPYRYSGELLTFNADNYCYSQTFEEFFYTMRNNPFAFGIFAHPHVIGGSTRGVWNYRPRLYHPKALTDLVKYVEVLGCPQGRENLLHEYVYSEALDAGFRLSTSCGSDQHHTWDFDLFPDAMIIMAPEKSREAFLDALLNLRAYACESGNIKLRVNVNGYDAPCDLPETNKYHFSVKIDYFREDSSTRPIRCEVISDGGKTLKTVEGESLESFEFDIESDTARWFYLRFVDSNTYRTFSPPIFTGRSVIPYEIDSLTPISKEKFSITEKSGKDASDLINNDPTSEWEADGTSAEFVIDMGEERCVSALGNYAVGLIRPRVGNVGDIMAKMEAAFPVDYRISTSTDGKNYTLADEGIFRTFSGEEIVKFEPRKARLVKLELLSTVGSRLGRAPYDKIPMKLAELTLFE